MSAAQCGKGALGPGARFTTAGELYSSAPAGSSRGRSVSGKVRPASAVGAGQ